MKKIDLRTAAERVLERVKAMSKDELKSALEGCSEGSVGYAFRATQSNPCMSFEQPVISCFYFLNNRTLMRKTEIGAPELAVSAGDAFTLEESFAANDDLYSLAA